MQQNLIQNQDSFPDTHYFIYKDKQYPIKYGFFKLSSKYFSKNSSNIKINKEIQLIEKDLEQNINLCEQSIIDFIKYVHREPILLTNDNVIEINYLAKKYEVSSLLELTTNYISTHHDELSIQIFTINQKDPSFTTEKYENIISDHFLDYIQDERLLTIPISTLYRIFSKFQEKVQKSTQNNEQTFEFLLKCLDKYGKEASVLFSLFNFDDSKKNYLNVLITKYSEKFDFNIINSVFQKKLYEQQNDIIRNEIENQNKQEEFQNLMKIELAKIREEMDSKLNENLNKIRIEFEEKMKKQKDEYEEKIASLKSEIKEHKDKIDEKSLHINEKVKNTEYNGSYFNGIINHLTKECGGNVHEKGIVNVTSSCKAWPSQEPKVVVDLENTGSYYATDGAGGTPNQWLKYDFKNIKIHPTHYTIRSRPDGGSKHYHPRSWVIEASNTDRDDDWKVLDSQNGVDYLAGGGLTHTFEIKQIGPNEYFRFVRFRQTDRNTGGDHNLRFSALEYFGKINS